MKLLFATGNTHKREELAAILPEHTIVIPEELGIWFEFEETGTTYLENALGKAMHLWTLARVPVIADDSGLSVPSLGGEPGVFSARYGARNGEKLSAAERNRYLLSRMEGLSPRDAFFVCAMTLVLGEYRVFTVQETLHGEILHEPRGTHGFGYDPLLFLPEYGRTVAELPEREKNRISHRGKAGAVIRNILSQFA